MAQQVEIEFKNLLSANEFSRLIDIFKLQQDDFITQINYYFDTPDFLLKQNNAALRIREKNKSYELTLKEPIEEGLLETTDILDKSTAEKLIHQSGPLPEGEVLTQLHKYSVDMGTIQLFGSLKTERAEVDYREGLLVFDKSSYFETVDYELEYEVSNSESGKSAFLSLLEQHKIPIRPTENKIVRFYKAKATHS